jgi:hypothetical protein
VCSCRRYVTRVALRLSGSSLQNTHQLFDTIATAAAAAKADAELEWNGASLAQRSAAQQKTGVSATSGKVAADVTPPCGMMLQSSAAVADAKYFPHAPVFLTPEPPSERGDDAKAFLRRIKTVPECVENAHQVQATTPVQLRAGSKLEAVSPEAGAGGPIAGAVPPPSTPFAEKFIRREARQEKKLSGAGSQFGALRRISYDSPVIAPLQMQRSRVSTPQVKPCI